MLLSSFFVVDAWRFFFVFVCCVLVLVCVILSVVGLRYRCLCLCLLLLSCVVFVNVLCGSLLFVVVGPPG